MPRGTIRRLMDRGFGFIKTEDDTDLFFHRNDLVGVEFSSLSEGQEVEFEKGAGRDGRSQAVNVRLPEAKAPADAPDDTLAESGDDEGGDDKAAGEDEAAGEDKAAGEDEAAGEDKA